MNQKSFDEWAVIELFGHQKIAGRVSEQSIGGNSFVRVDVPEVNGSQPFTKLFGNGAIYAITITDEKTASMVAASCNQEPMDQWSAERYLRQLQPGSAETKTDENELEDTF